MKVDDNSRRNIYPQDEMSDSVSLSAAGDVFHLIQYFAQTEPGALTDPEYLLEQFGITAEELEWILTLQR